MPNTITAYNPIFYAQEALIQLEKALGMAGRVHRGYDEERRSFAKGETISIRRPSTFTAANAPATAAELATDYVNLTLEYWREVKFALTDKELAFTGERIIRDHIRPAAYALADDIDQKLVALYKDIPWFHDLKDNGSTDVTDITGVRRAMFDSAVPLFDVGNMHYMIDGNLEQGLLVLPAFTQHQGAGDTGVAAQMRGTLGMKYGFEIFANQNVPLHTSGSVTAAAPKVSGAHSKGASSVTLYDTTLTGTLKAGDSLVIAGHSQRYAVTADAAASSNAISVSITPKLTAACSGDEAVTIRTDTHRANLAFHRNAFALAMAPLSEMGNDLGAKIATITDPVTGLSLRSRVYYVGNSSEVHVALDVLYGVTTLDPNLACRGCGQS